MKRVVSTIQFAMLEFGPLIIFYAVNHFYGVKPAIVSSLAWALVDAAWRRFKGRSLSALFIYSLVMTILFSVVDLSLDVPVLVKFEAALSNFVTAGFFALSMRRGRKTVIQEFAEKRAEAQGETLGVTPDRTFFFTVSTGFWAAYFVFKAGLYAWIAGRYSLEESLVIRTVFGNVTFYGLMFLNIYFAGKIRVALVRLRRWFLPATPLDVSGGDEVA